MAYDPLEEALSILRAGGASAPASSGGLQMGGAPPRPEDYFEGDPLIREGLDTLEALREPSFGERAGAIWEGTKEAAGAGLGVLGLPFRGLGLLFEEGREALTGVPSEARVAEDYNVLTGAGIEQPGLAERSMQGLEDLAGVAGSVVSGSDPLAGVKSQTTAARTAERNALLEQGGSIGRVGKVARAIATTGLQAGLDPAFVVLGPLAAAAKGSRTAAAVHAAVQRGLQTGMGIQSIQGIEHYIDVGEARGFDSPEADDIGAETLAQLGMIVGLEAHGLAARRAEARVQQQQVDARASEGRFVDPVAEREFLTPDRLAQFNAMLTREARDAYQAEAQPFIDLTQGLTQTAEQAGGPRPGAPAPARALQGEGADLVRLSPAAADAAGVLPSAASGRPELKPLLDLKLVEPKRQAAPPRPEDYQPNQQLDLAEPEALDFRLEPPAEPRAPVATTEVPAGAPDFEAWAKIQGLEPAADPAAVSRWLQEHPDATVDQRAAARDLTPREPLAAARPTPQEERPIPPPPPDSPAPPTAQELRVPSETPVGGGVLSETPRAVDVAATAAAQPTEAQAEAGNYRKGHTRLSGLDISIENQAGSKRRPEWPELNAHYGYIKGTVGKDKDHIDVFVRPETPDAYSGPVHVVNQLNEAGKFDEHKVLLGWESQADAVAAYEGNYTPGAARYSGVRTFESPAALRDWLRRGDTKRPVSVPAIPRDAAGVRLLPGEEQLPTAERKLVDDRARQALDDLKRREAEVLQAVNHGGDAELAAVGLEDLIVERRDPNDTRVEQVLSDLYGADPTRRAARIRELARGRTPLADVRASVKEIEAALDRGTGSPLEAMVREAVRRSDPGYAEAAAAGFVPGGAAGRSRADRRREALQVSADRRLADRRQQVAAKMQLEAGHPAVDALLAAEKEARTDPLTGLGNKRAWEELQQTVTEDDSVVVLDGKRFKTINDTYGHETGDRILKLIAESVRRHFGDEAARFGGDEFGAVLRGLDAEEIQARGDAVVSELGALTVHVQMPDGTTVDIPGIQVHLGFGKDYHAADLAANAEAAPSRKGGRGDLEAQGLREGERRPEPAVARGPGQGREGDRGPASEGELATRPAERPAPPPTPEDYEAATAPRPTAVEPDAQSALLIPTRAGVVVQPKGGEPFLAGQRPAPPEAKGAQPARNAATAKRSAAEAERIRPKVGKMSDAALSERESHYAKNRFDEAAEVVRAERGRRASRSEKPVAKEPEAAAAQEPGRTGGDRLSDMVLERLDRGEAIKDNRAFTEMANEAFGGSRGKGTFTPRDAYDALEAGVNRWILQAKDFPAGLFEESSASQVKARVTLGTLREMLRRLPTQTDRTREQVELQQFSTPPTQAFVAAKALGIRPGEVLLEPSGGTGSLAVWAKLAGADVRVNEIAPRRAEILRRLGFETTSVDAEYLNDLLPESIRPTAILMNPPFSSTGGRVKAHRTEFGAKHVEQALERLSPGGRLVAIVGEGMAFEGGKSRTGKAATGAAFRDWWAGIMDRYNVRANVGIPGDEYQKYGTGFGNQILVIDKTGATPGASLAERMGSVKRGAMKDLGEALDALRPIAEDRPAASARTEPRAAVVAAKPAGAVGSGGAGVPASATEGREARGGRPGVRPGAGRPEPAGAGAGAEPPSVPAVEPAARPAVEPAVRAGAGGASDAGGGVEKPSGPVRRETETGGTFVRYAPAKLGTKGLAKHPAKIVEAASMAAVDPPDVQYKPSLAPEVLSEGRLSDVQYETVSYAGQRHEQLLPDGSRAGHFIGDGTGVGKGREIAGIALDNFNRGRKRTLWVSVSRDLIEAARGDLDDVAGKGRIQIRAVNDFPVGGDIDHPEGVIFTTYSSLISKGKQVKGEGAANAAAGRQAQIERWLGKDGVIVFDEAHKAKNALAEGRAEPTQTGQAVIELQRNLPGARVVYVSATGATDTRNMAYMTRLGLWAPEAKKGPGLGAPTAEETAASQAAHASRDKYAFPGGFSEFLNEVESGGVGAKEMVARDLKALGMYNSRSISFEGVDYREVIHELGREQLEMYDAGARAWQVVLQNINAAIETTGGGSNQRTQAMKRFWNDHQRFFRQVTTALKMPSVINEAEAALKRGESVIITLKGTGESKTSEQVSKATAEGRSLDELDFTPRETIAQMVENAFPTQLFEEVAHPTDPERTVRVPVMRDGKPVESKAALEMKRKVLEGLSDLNLPDNPLDQIINHFGAKNVAEMTGRKRRLIRGKDGKTTYEKRSGDGVAADKVNLHEMQQFQDGKKRVAVISRAASTGISLHSSLRAKNQQRRHQIAAELDWSADSEMQTFGRSHRSDQASAPTYTLVSTNVGGEKRFSSTIARRLASLGALSKGQRDASGGGELAKYNFETPEGEAALQRTYGRLMERVPLDDVDTLQALKDMGILKEREGGGSEVDPKDRRDVPRFLNRILALDVGRQNVLFDEFMRQFDGAIQRAKSEGTFDEGVADLKGDAIRLKGKPQLIHTDEITGAKTEHYAIEVDRKTTPLPWKRASSEPAASGEGVVDYTDPLTFRQAQILSGFYRNKQSGGVVLMAPGGTRTLRTGETAKMVLVDRPSGSRGAVMPAAEFASKFEAVKPGAAEKLWNEAVAKVPKTVTDEHHIIAGAILPLWSKLKTTGDERLKIVRAETQDGQRVVGVSVPKADVGRVLQALGVGRTFSGAEDVYRAAWEQGDTVGLSEGLALRKSRVRGEERIELVGAKSTRFEQLRGLGLIEEKVEWKDRFFVPTDEALAVPMLRKLLKQYPTLESRPAPPPADVRFAASPGDSVPLAVAKALQTGGDAIGALAARPDSYTAKDWLRDAAAAGLDRKDARALWNGSESRRSVGKAPAQAPDRLSVAASEALRLADADEASAVRDLAADPARLKRFAEAVFIDEAGKTPEAVAAEVVKFARRVKENTSAFAASAEHAGGAPSVDLARVRRAFRGAEWSAREDGRFEATINGKLVTVEPDATIRVSEAERSSLSRSAEAQGLPDTGEAAGATTVLPARVIVRLAKGAGDQVIDHEALHVAMGLALTDAERRAVLRRYGFKESGHATAEARADAMQLAEERAAEAYSKWTPKTPNGLFSRIASFFRRVYRSFFPDAETVFGRVRSGEAFSRRTARPAEPRTGADIHSAVGYAAKAVGDRVENFRRWFSGSKVVDPSGGPVIVYHGTNAKAFDAFNTLGEGAHFGSREQAAEAARRNPGDGKRKLLPVYLSIQNPLRLPDLGVWSNFNNVHRHLSVEDHITPRQADAAWAAYQRSDADGWKALKQALRKNGHDGIVYENELEGSGDSYIAFEPTQVKSVRNRGTYDPNDPRMAYAARPSPGQRGLFGSEGDVPVATTRKQAPQQADLFGAKDMLQPTEARVTEGRERDGALFTQEADARARQEASDQKTMFAAQPAPKPEPGPAPPRTPSDIERAAEAGKDRDRDAIHGKPPDFPINLERIGLDEDVKQAEARIVQELAGRLGAARGYRSWAEARELALRSGLNEADFIKLQKQRGAVSDHQITAGRLLREEAAKDVTRKLQASREAAGGPDALEAERSYLASVTRLGAIAQATVGAGAEAGRALAAHRMMSEGLLPGERFFNKLLRMHPAMKPQVRDRLLKAVTEGNQREIIEAARLATEPKRVDKFLEAWKAGLVSGPQTLLGNVLSNSVFEVWRTAERGVAGGLETLLASFQGREAERSAGEAFAALQGLTGSLPGALKLLVNGLAEERIRPGSKYEGHVGAIGGRTGRIVRLPFRILQAFDDAAKHMASQAELQSQAFRMALRASRKPGADRGSFERLHHDFVTRAQAYAEARALRDAGVSLDDAAQLALRDREAGLIFAAMDRAAHEATFQDEVGRFTRTALDARTAARPLGIPLGDIVAPFLKTPSRILAQAAARTPLGFLKALEVWKQVKAGKATHGEFSEALAKPLMGTMLGIGLYMAARQGLITGGGPADDRKRKLLEATGWQPYSVRVGDSYVSFKRLEPLATILGLAADLSEARNEQDAGTVAEKLQGALIQNITEKSWLTGFASLSEAWQDPKRYGPRWLRQLEGSLVPNVARKAAAALDPTVRDTSSGVLAPIVAGLPGLSRTLPERKLGTGSPLQRGGTAVERFLSPFPRTEEREGTELERELLELDYSPSPPGRTLLIPGSKTRIELSEAEIEVLYKADRRTTDRLRKLVRTSRWLALDGEQRRELVEREYAAGRRAARELLYGTPTFSRKVRDARAAKRLKQFEASP